jgi:glycosyltransferase involved in cell wall biosynthesis
VRTIVDPVRARDARIEEGMNSPRTVVFVSYSAAVWGAEVVLLELGPRLESAGLDPTLLSPRGDFADRWKDLGLRHLELDVGARSGIRSGVKTVSPCAKLRQLSDELKKTMRSVSAIRSAAKGSDLLHSNSLWSHLDVTIAALVSRTPVVLHLHDFVNRGLGKVLLSIALLLSSRAIAVSESVYRSFPWVTRARMVIAPRGVDIDLFNPKWRDEASRQQLQRNAGDKLIGIVGRVDAEKGIDQLVDAVYKLQHANSRLVVVGEAFRSESYANSLRAYAFKMLEERVVFVGRSEAVPFIIANLDVLVNASKSEPLGGTVLEGFASATPVVAFNSGGPAELIDDRLNGRLAICGDVDDMARCIDWVLEDRARAIQMGKAARDKAEREYSWDGNARKMFEVYESCLAGRTCIRWSRRKMADVDSER